VSAVAAAHSRLQEAVEELRAAAESALATDAELLSVLTVAEGLCRRLDQVTVSTVAVLQRRGGFGERGYKQPAGALCDLLGWEGFQARRRVVAAEQVCERVGVDGTVLAARLPCTGKAFAAGQATLRHVEVIAGLLGGEAAGRLTEPQRAGVEEQLAAKAGEYRPGELRTWGKALIAALDGDGPTPDDEDERPRESVNELRLRRHRDGSGGTLSGSFDDAAMFDAIATLIDAKATPLDADDRRGLGRRQAEALADVCGFVLDHGDHAGVPQAGGRRPHLNVLIRLEELERRARDAVLDFGGTLSPESVRMLACDAAVVPIVMGGCRAAPRRRPRHPGGSGRIASRGHRAGPRVCAPRL
jgi:5-methylcytosine-specific restriction protein A